MNRKVSKFTDCCFLGIFLKLANPLISSGLERGFKNSLSWNKLISFFFYTKSVKLNLHIKGWIPLPTMLTIFDLSCLGITIIKFTQKLLDQQAQTNCPKKHTYLTRFFLSAFLRFYLLTTAITLTFCNLINVEDSREWHHTPRKNLSFMVENLFLWKLVKSNKNLCLKKYKCVPWEISPVWGKFIKMPKF